MVEREGNLYVIVCENCEKKSKPYVSYNNAIAHCILQNGWKRDWRRTLCELCWEELKMRGE